MVANALACLLRGCRVYKEGQDEGKVQSRESGIAIVGRPARTCTTSVGQAISTESIQIDPRRGNSVEKDKRHEEANRRRDRGLMYAVISWPWDGFIHTSINTVQDHRRGSVPPELW